MRAAGSGSDTPLAYKSLSDRQRAGAAGTELQHRCQRERALPNRYRTMNAGSGRLTGFWLRGGVRFVPAFVACVFVGELACAGVFLLAVAAAVGGVGWRRMAVFSATV